PVLPPGTRLRFGALGAVVVDRSALSPRLVRVTFDVVGDALWAALYREGRPVQYSHVPDRLPLWAVQTVYAGRPWAFEMPSAARRDGHHRSAHRRPSSPARRRRHPLGRARAGREPLRAPRRLRGGAPAGRRLGPRGPPGPAPARDGRRDAGAAGISAPSCPWW